MTPVELRELWRRDPATALYQARSASVDRLEIAEELLAIAEESRRLTSQWENAARVAVELRMKEWPPGTERAAYAALPLGELYQREGRFADAEAVLVASEAVAIGYSDSLRDVLIARGKLALAAGRDADAEAAFLRAADVEEAGRHPKRSPVTLPLTELAALYARQNRFADAAAIKQKELAILGGRISPRDRAIVETEIRELLAKAFH